MWGIVGDHSGKASFPQSILRQFLLVVTYSFSSRHFYLFYLKESIRIALGARVEQGPRAQDRFWVSGDEVSKKGKSVQM